MFFILDLNYLIQFGIIFNSQNSTIKLFNKKDVQKKKVMPIYYSFNQKHN